MKRLAFLAVILSLSTMLTKADEVITVSATNADISANLDLKVVAKLFGEAKNLEEFEAMLNDPQSTLVNLDLNGDGQVDYIRVVEARDGNKHLIVLQAVLAKDIYQDVASIYVEKDELTSQVNVQVIGDEYLYGRNYIIEPIFIYRPIIYDWFWSPYWTCWHSPWYWGFYPHGWYAWGCMPYYAYVNHCYGYCQAHVVCSFHYTHTARSSSRTMGEGLRRNDYAKARPQQTFTARNSGATNARQLEPSIRANATTYAARSTASTAATHATAVTTSARPAASTSARPAASSSARPAASSSARPATTTSYSTQTTRSTAATSQPVKSSSTSSSSATSTRTTTTTSSSSSRSTYSTSARSTNASSSQATSTYHGGYSGGSSSRSTGGASTRR